jgi:hypothetical protein
MEQKHHVVDLLFSLSLFCVFAATALMLVMMGANVYQKTVDDMSHNYDTRTSLSYLSEKIRQADALDAISADSLNGEPALVLSQTIDGELYETWVYAFEGQLYEVMIPAQMPLEPENGQPIMEIDSFSVDFQDRLVRLSVTGCDGTTSSVCISPRCLSAAE